MAVGFCTNLISKSNSHLLFWVTVATFIISFWKKRTTWQQWGVRMMHSWFTSCLYLNFIPAQQVDKAIKAKHRHWRNILLCIGQAVFSSLKQDCLTPKQWGPHVLGGPKTSGLHGLWVALLLYCLPCILPALWASLCHPTTTMWCPMCPSVAWASPHLKWRGEQHLGGILWLQFNPLQATSWIALP